MAQQRRVQARYHGKENLCHSDGTIVSRISVAKVANVEKSEHRQHVACHAEYPQSIDQCHKPLPTYLPVPRRLIRTSKPRVLAEHRSSCRSRRATEPVFSSHLESRSSCPPYTSIQRTGRPKAVTMSRREMQKPSLTAHSRCRKN